MTLRDKPVNPTPKKTYRSPVLRVYGDIRAITQSVGSLGAMDGGTMAGRMMTR